MDGIDNNYKRSPSQLFSFAQGTYLDRTSRPIYALAYLLGFIIFYEIGSFLINPQILSESLAEPQGVVSFVLVQNIFEYLGFSPRATWLAVPMAVIIILLALQVTSRRDWSVQFKDFVPMTFECVLLSVPLIVLSLFLNGSGSGAESDLTACVKSFFIPVSNGVGCESIFLVDIIMGIGAGIYEELIFRLILICLLMVLMQDFLGFSKMTSVVFSVVVSSLLFSAHHHVFFVNGRFQAGELFSVSRFIFRFFAGVYFAVVFAARGFGISGGTQAVYNVIVVLLNWFLLN